VEKNSYKSDKHISSLDSKSRKSQSGVDISLSRESKISKDESKNYNI